MLKAILFDLDDTLIDWSKRTLDWRVHYDNRNKVVFDYVCETIQPITDKPLFCETMWVNTVEAWDKARKTMRAPHIGDVMLQTCEAFGVNREKISINALIDAYNWGPFPGVTPFDEIHETLSDLQNHVQFGLVTNAYVPMRVRYNELDAYNLTQYFEDGMCFSAADVGYLKPHPYIFEVALDALQVQPHEAIFIGDSLEADILGAQNSGMKAIWRKPLETNGSHKRLDIVPDAEIATFHELYPLLDLWYPNWRNNIE